MASAVPPSVLLAASLAAGRFVEATDTAHNVASIALRTLCVGLIILALVPARSAYRKSAWAAQASLYALIWCVKVGLYGARSINGGSRSFEAFLSRPTHHVIAVELLCALALQVPLYDLNVFLPWTILVSSCLDVAVTSSLVAKYTQTSWWAILLALFLAVTLVPYTVHVVQRRSGNHRRSATTPLVHSQPADNRNNGHKDSTCNPSVSKQYDNYLTSSTSHVNDTPVPGAKSRFKSCAETGSDVVSRQGAADVVGLPQPLKAVGNESAVDVSDLMAPEQEGLHVQVAPMPVMANGVACKPAYRSKLAGRRRVACIKLDTNLHPSQLPSNLTAQLEASLQDICGYALCNVAVRHGCILIKMDLMGPASEDTTFQHKQHNTKVDVQQLAGALLPVLKALSIIDGSSLKHQAEVARIQLDAGFVRCYWDGHQQSWQYVYEDVAAAGEEPRATIGLTTLSDSHHSYHHPDGKQCSQRVTASNSLNPRMTTGSPTSSLLLDVDVYGIHDDVRHSSMGTKQLIQGWSPPTGKHDDNNMDWDDGTVSSNMPEGEKTFQLLAHVGDMYCTTHVIASRPARHGDGMTITIRLDMSQGNAGMLHHPSQKPPCIQLVTLELWSSMHMLSSRTVVLPPPAKPGNEQNSPAARQPTPCWWWGSSPATVTAAMAELDTLFLQSSISRQMESIDSHVQFTEDLTVWLTSVRQMSMSNGMCRIGSEQAQHQAGLPNQCALTTKEVQQLGSDLLTYAKQINATNLQRLLQQQLRYISHDHGRSCGVHTAKGGTRVFQFLRNLQCSVVGFECHQCEQAYRSRLSQHLATTQATYVVLAILMGVVSFVAACRDRDRTLVFNVAIWLAPHCIVAVHHYGRTSRPATCSPATALSLLAATFNWLCRSLGIMRAPAFVVAVHQTPVSLVLHLILACGEQLQSSIILPAPVVATCAFLIATSMTVLSACGGHQWLPALLLHLLVTVLARLLADVHLRGILVPTKSISSKNKNCKTATSINNNNGSSKTNSNPADVVVVNGQYGAVTTASSESTYKRKVRQWSDADRIQLQTGS